MAANLIDLALGALLPSYATDTVAIFTQDYAQVLKHARPLKVVVKESAKVMEHPIETGATIVDHRIILPVEIELSLIIPRYLYHNEYDLLKGYYLNSTLLTIQTRTGIYTNQLIQSMPHEEDASQYDAIAIAMSTKQVQFVMAQFVTTPKNKSNSNTVSTGMQQGKPATPQQSTLLFDAGKYASGGLKSLFSGVFG